MKSITLTDENGSYTIEPSECGDHISDYFEKLCIPALNAAGFSDEVIKKWLDDE